MVTVAPHEPPALGADVVELTKWLCSVESPIGDEAQLCDLVLQRARRWPLAGEPLRVLNSFSVPLTRGTGGPHIVLAGHLDTVRTQHDGPTRIEGDRLYGAGSADMKSGLALMIAAAEDRTLTDDDEGKYLGKVREQAASIGGELRG